MAHGLMIIEAMNFLGWPVAGLAGRLRKHSAEIPRLPLYRQSLVRIGQMGMHVMPISEHLILAAANCCQQYELLAGDGLVSVMQYPRLARPASLDADFDRVPGLTRYAPQ